MSTVVSKEKSTTVRSSDWLRPAVYALSWLSPGLSGELAGRWFFHTRRFELRPEERAALEQGRAERIGFRAGTLAAWKFAPSDVRESEVGAIRDCALFSTRTGATAEYDGGRQPPVLLVHGWNGRAGQLAPLALQLARAGRTAIVFDAPAHGDSDGASTTIPEMARAARVVAEAYGGVSDVVAHSVGAIAVTLGMSEGWQLDRVLLIAPPISSENWLHRFANTLGIAEEARIEMRRFVERRAGTPLERLDPLPQARTTLAELLLIHDAGDREVPFAAGKAIFDAWPNADLVRTTGLGHRRILSDPEVVGRAVRFLSKPAMPPRSELAHLLG